MKSTNDNPIDPLGTLGQVIRQPTAPDPIKSFESQSDRPLISDAGKALESIVDTLKKKWGGVIVEEHGFED